MAKRKSAHVKNAGPGPERDVDHRPDEIGPGLPDAGAEEMLEAIELPEEVSQLLHRLEVERDEALAARQRALADFVNYQRRATENESRALSSGAAGVVRSIIPAIDHLDLALSQDLDQVAVEQLAAGVELVRDELFKALDAHGVSRIDPEVGSEFDPNQHQAMMRQEAEGFEPNCIVAVYQPGYSLGELIIRPAKVVVSAAPEANDDEPGEC